MSMDIALTKRSSGCWLAFIKLTLLRGAVVQALDGRVWACNLEESIVVVVIVEVKVVGAFIFV